MRGLIIFLVVNMFAGPIIGLIVQLIYDHVHHKKFELKGSDTPLWEVDDKNPIPPAPDFCERRSLEDVLDNRMTNIFRPWGGLF